jgi:hypothetical protein
LVSTRTEIRQYGDALHAIGLDTHGNPGEARNDAGRTDHDPDGIRPGLALEENVLITDVGGGGERV